MTRTIALTVGAVTAAGVMALGLAAAGFGQTSGPAGPVAVDVPAVAAEDVIQTGQNEMATTNDAARVVLVGPDGSTTTLDMTASEPGGVDELVRALEAQLGSSADPVAAELYVEPVAAADAYAYEAEYDADEGEYDDDDDDEYEDEDEDEDDD